MWKLSLKNFIQFYLLCCNLVLIQPSFLAVCRAGPILTQIIIWVQCTKTPKIYIEVFFALKYYVSFLYIRFSPFQGFYTYVYDTNQYLLYKNTVHYVYFPMLPVLYYICQHGVLVHAFVSLRLRNRFDSCCWLSFERIGSINLLISFSQYHNI